MGVAWKRQLLSDEIMSKMLYMNKTIAKILNTKNIFGSECSSLKLIVRAPRNNGYTYLYKIMRLFHPIFMNESVYFQTPSNKNPMYLPDHVKNLNYVKI